MPLVAKKGRTVKGGATVDSGDLITRSRRQLHLPPIFFFFRLVAPIGRSFWDFWGLKIF